MLDEQASRKTHYSDGWDERLGAGFENPSIPESQHSYTMLTIRAWLQFGTLMGQIGEKQLAEKYMHYAFDKIKDQRNNSAWPDKFGLHAAADAINTGLTTAEEDANFYTRNFTDRVNRLSYSPFNEYFIIGAMARMQRYEDAISAIKDCWGGQINYGGTSTFEVYRSSWNNILGKNDSPPNNQCGYVSLTHPWGAGVVKWLSEEIMGIKPVELGFKTFEIVPHLAGGVSWVRGQTPTPQGTISVNFNIKTGVASFTVPAGTLARRVALPLSGSHVIECYVNSQLVWSKSASVDTNQYNIQDGYLNLKNIQPGTYHCRLFYGEGKLTNKVVKKSEWVYPIKAFVQDCTTSGNWKSRYGKDGYILFNYRKNESNVNKTPAYIKSVKLKNAGNVHLNLPGRAMQILNDTIGNTKYLGAITTQDPQPMLQTMTLDLEVSDTKAHRLALYFLDWDSNERRSAVEIFDLKTLKLISSVQLIKRYEKGKYLVFNYSGSIRIRINQIRGKNAALSGLFFD